jgi:3-methyladenine DNA glycosylase AlkD
MISSEKTYEAFKNDLYGAGYSPTSFQLTAMAGPELKTSFVKIPQVKAAVRKYVGDPALVLENFALDESVELTLAYFWLSLERLDTFAEQMRFLSKKLPYARSWMITDGLPQAIGKASFADYLPYFRRFRSSRSLYERRFAYVFALRYVHEKDIAPLLQGYVPETEYYGMMAQAWLLATLGIDHFDEIVRFLKENELPLALKRKSVSKMMDSFRISSKKKNILKALRKNF